MKSHRTIALLVSLLAVPALLSLAGAQSLTDSGRFLGHRCKYNPGAARSDVHASDRENEGQELLLRRVRPVSRRWRSVCGWYWSSAQHPS